MKIVFPVVAALTLSSCTWFKKMALLAPTVPPTFSVVQDRRLDELSGIAVSPDQPGVLFVHNDSGDSSRFFAIGPDGALKAIFHFPGEPTARLGVRDVEDIAIGPGPDSGVNYIYLGDIGDNSAERGFVTIYRIKEPLVPGSSSAGSSTIQASPNNPASSSGTTGNPTSSSAPSPASPNNPTSSSGTPNTPTPASSNYPISSSATSTPSTSVKTDVPHFEVAAEPLYLKYPDGARDAETLMIDPILRQIYIVSKREDSVHVYSTPLDFSPRTTRTLVRNAKLHFPGLDKWITAGDISQKGDQILIKSYTGVFYWRRRLSRAGNLGGPTDSNSGHNTTSDRTTGHNPTSNRSGGNADTTTGPEPIWMALLRPYTLQPYEPERQGEAIGFSTDGKGFYTVSEGRRPRLYYYPLAPQPPKPH